MPGLEDVLPQIDSLQVVYCQSWPYDDPVGRLAAALGASPRHRLYSGIGGTTPQDLVNRTAEAMQRGELDLALICSAEALATVRAAKKRGERLPWSHRKSSPFPWEPPHPSETRPRGPAGVGDVPAVGHRTPGQTRCVAGRRRHRGRDDDGRHERGRRRQSARLAADGAWMPPPSGPPPPDNRYVGWPYTKHEVAVMDVDMSAALLLATQEKADALGVTEDRRLYLERLGLRRGPGEHRRTRRHVTFGGDVGRRPARALAQRVSTLDDIDAFDLYSCFPSSLRFGCDALGLAVDDPRGLTITGGLPYAGGPASGYLTHAIASAFDSLATRSRARPADRCRHAHGQTRCGRVVVDAGRRRRFTAGPGCAPGRSGRRAAAPPRSHHLVRPGDRVRLHRRPRPRRCPRSRGWWCWTPRMAGRWPACTTPICSPTPSRRELVGRSVTVTTDGTRNEARW